MQPGDFELGGYDAICGGCGRGIPAGQTHTMVYGVAYHVQCAPPEARSVSPAPRRVSFHPDNRVVDGAPEWNAVNAEFNALWKANADHLLEAAGNKALEAAEQSGNPLILALSFKNLAAWYGRHSAFKKSEPLYERALYLIEEARGPDHPDVVEFLVALADAQEARAHYLKAAPLRERALVIHEKAFGADHPGLAVTLRNLARTYAALLKFDQARLLFGRALSIDERLLGPEHFGLLRTLNNLAHCCEALGDTVRARELYERSLAISEKESGPGKLMAGWCLGQLAAIHARQGEKARAESLRLRARPYLRQYKGENPDGLYF